MARNTHNTLGYISTISFSLGLTVQILSILSCMDLAKKHTFN